MKHLFWCFYKDSPLYGALECWAAVYILPSDAALLYTLHLDIKRGESASICGTATGGAWGWGHYRHERTRTVISGDR